VQRSGLVGVLATGVAAVALAHAYGARSAPTTDACGVPDTGTVWIDYGEGAVKPDTRAVLARPGVVIAASGTALPATYRKRGAASAYFVSGLAKLVGQPATPADPATIGPAVDALYGKAAASTSCATPWIALNELFGSGLATPWSPTNAQYRANVLALMQGLAAHGAHPVLWVPGNPNVAGDAAAWWNQVAQTGGIAYESYYDARRISALGSLLGNRRVRIGMRLTLGSFVRAGVPASRLGLVLGFHSGQIAGAGGRQGLQPREAWLRVVKWETLAAQRVALDMHLGSIWSWGWGTFGAGSADADKPAAACVYLWARNQSLCDGPAAGGSAFNASLTEGQIVLPPGVLCNLVGSRRIQAADVTSLAAFTGTRSTALDTLFARLVFRSLVPIGNAQVLAAEQQAIDRDFAGDRSAYLSALAKAHASPTIARGLMLDELRRRAIPELLATQGKSEPPYQWEQDWLLRSTTAIICARDELPGTSIPGTDATRNVSVAPLLQRLPFLFDDTTPPTAPVVSAAAVGKTVQLQWNWPPETDAAGFIVYRSTTPGGPYLRLNSTPLVPPQFVDTTAAPGTPSYYVVTTLDTSGNESAQSNEVSTTPGG
jgi:hypothetical protein